MSITQNPAWHQALEDHLLFGIQGPIETLRWLSISESEQEVYKNLTDWMAKRLPKATLLSTPEQVSSRFPTALDISLKERISFLIKSRERDLNAWEHLEKLKSPSCKDTFTQIILEAGMRKNLSLSPIPVNQILSEEISLLQTWEKEPNALLSDESAIKIVIKVKGFLASFQSRK